MFRVSEDWNPLQTQLRGMIGKEESERESRALLLRMHAMVHAAGVYGGRQRSFLDEVVADLDEFSLRTMPTVKDVTIAWNVWHITRIEDLVANILIADGPQILNDAWSKRLNTRVRDTGNAMTDHEILTFSREVDREELYAYRNAVGRQTKAILEALPFPQWKCAVPEQRLGRIREEGGVLVHPDSIWLLDFWGKKTVAGLLLMPITRHQVVHLNDCVKLKAKCARILARGREK